MISARVRPKDLLRKLDPFGNSRGEQVNLEYPTEAIFEQMPSGLTLTSIEFSTYHKIDTAISGIKLRYSNMKESPLLKKDGVHLHHTQSINFNHASKVARV